ncbi:hypothetical protein E2C01_033338 [Portunus trituberculatus]|uniref:Uncharacterized protein n=1 Tax=Portunus trituberculatus TaxID=210409 RepID=A0A5B7F3S6_PORTR|nr:hypothetical protein [Portunus trituberculatus]
MQQSNAQQLRCHLVHVSEHNGKKTSYRINALLTTLGVNGGFTLRCSRASQSMSRKNLWFLMACSPPRSTTQPNRLDGSLVMNCMAQQNE